MPNSSQYSFKNHFRLTLLATCLSLCYSPMLSASIVRADVDYQYFRDFAENKGAFTVGASNIPIVDRTGKSLGVMLDKIPMIDFSPVSRHFALATLIDPQYVVGVQHNETYPAVSFGAQGNPPDAHHYHYFLTSRNDYPTPPTQQFPLVKEDFHVPRLHKLVTETAPTALSSAGSDPAVYQSDRFATFVSIGAGLQKVEQPDNKTRQVLSDGYEYLIGGASLAVGGQEKHRLNLTGSLFSGKYGPLITYGAPGDSGSPLFGYDTKEKRWVLAGVLELWWGADAKHNRYTIPHTDFIQHVQQQDLAGIINNTVHNATYLWHAKGKTSQIQHGTQHLNVDLKDDALTPQDTAAQRPSLAHGKNVHFVGRKGKLHLKDNIDQGAGALYFHTDFEVAPEQQQTYLGGGVFVAKNSTVQWKVANPAGDRLSKIGKGTLHVNGQGVNQGDLSVGDGLVILDQQADRNGNKQAFNQVGITSGRATLVLNSADQLHLDNLYFGYRGGRLDTNGLKLTFNYIQNTDEGARIVNQNKHQRAELHIKGYAPFDPSEIVWQTVGFGYNTALNALYEAKDKTTGQTQGYYILTGNNPTQPFPSAQQSDENWQFISQDKANAIKFIVDRNNRARQQSTFSGYFGETDPSRTNGAMDITYTPTLKHATWLLSGGMNLNGTFTVSDGIVALSGRPTPHAMDMQNKKDVIKDHDWLNRLFEASEFSVQNHAKLYVGRNVAQVKGQIHAKNQAQLHVGFKANDPVCHRSDYTGQTHCQSQALTDHLLRSLPKTRIQGNIQLRDQASLDVGFAQVEGKIDADRTTTITLHPHSHWLMGADSRIGHLRMMGAPHTSTISFSQPKGDFHTLTVAGDLTGQGVLDFRLDAQTLNGDRLQVEGDIQGEYTLNVSPEYRPTPRTAFFNRQETPEVTALELKSRLTLLTSRQQRSAVRFHSKPVDIGAYRYDFVTENHNNQLSLRLTNPVLEARIAEEETKLAVQLAQQKSYISQATNTALSLLSSQANIALHVGQNLDRHYLTASQTDGRLWTNHALKKTHNASKHYRTYQQTNHLTQFGLEGALNSAGNLHLGAVLSTIQSEQRFDGNHRNKTQWLEGSAYLKKRFDSGWFTVLEGRLASSKNQLTQEGTQTALKQRASVAGLSVGYHGSWHSLAITPMLTARYHRFNANDYRLTDLPVQTDTLNFITYQAALQLTKAFDFGRWTLLSHATSYYVDATQNPLAVQVDKHAFTQQFGRYFTQELGLTANLKQWQVSSNLGVSRGNETGQQHHANVQISYRW